MTIRPKDVYHGHRRGLEIITILVSFFVVLIAVAAYLFYSLQKYVVVYPDGVRLELPFMRSPAPDTGEPSEGGVSAGDVNLIIDAPSYDDVSLNMGQELLPVRAVYVKAADITPEFLENVASQLEDRGANAMLLEMKPASGLLSWNSNAEMALSYAVSGEADIQDAIAELKEQEIYMIAELSCCLDSLMAGRNTPLALKTVSGANYQSAEGLWLDSYNRTLRTYIFSLIDELFLMGFDEVLFTNLACPAVEGLVHTVSGSATFGADTAISNFSRAAAERMQGTGMRLSLLLDAPLLRGDDDAKVTGQNVGQLSLFYDRFFLLDPSDGDRTLATAHMEGDTRLRFVPFVAEAEEGECWVLGG